MNSYDCMESVLKLSEELLNLIKKREGDKAIDKAQQAMRETETVLSKILPKEKHDLLYILRALTAITAFLHAGILNRSEKEIKELKDILSDTISDIKKLIALEKKEKKIIK